MLILASQRKARNEPLRTFCCWTLWICRKSKEEPGGGGRKITRIYFVSRMLPPHSTDITLILCCPCVCLWLDSMFYSAQKSCKVGMWSLCVWKVPNVSEAVGYQVRKSLSVWRPAQPVSFQAPTQPIFCLFYLLGEETSPTISLAPPFRVGWTLYVFYFYVCI